MERIAPEQVAAYVATLGADARNVQGRIHIAAVSTLEHTAQSGDFRGAIALLSALPNGTRVKALAAWYREFSGKQLSLTYDPKARTWGGKLKDGWSAEHFDVARAESVTFADLTSEIEPKVMDKAAYIKMLERTSTNDKQIEIDGKKVDKVTPEARALAAKVVAFVRNLPTTQAA